MVVNNIYSTRKTWLTGFQVWCSLLCAFMSFDVRLFKSQLLHFNFFYSLY